MAMHHVDRIVGDGQAWFTWSVPLALIMPRPFENGYIRLRMCDRSAYMPMRCYFVSC